MTPPRAIDRRFFLRLGAGGLAAGGLASALPFAPSALGAVPPPMPSGKKLLLVFLRGGNDGVNSVIPSHDPQYSAALRPTIFVPPAQRLDLQSGGAAFHPSLARLKEVFDSGEVAVLHRVGYSGSNLSHFSSQQFWETAKPHDEDFTEGFVARWIRHFAPSDPLPAVCVSDGLQLAFNGAMPPVPLVPDLTQYSLGSDPVTAKLLGSAPGQGSAGSGLLGLFHGQPDPAVFDELVRDTGVVMADTIAGIAQLPPVSPAPALYPTTDTELNAEGLAVKPWARKFFRNLRDAVHVLKHATTNVAGIELNKFDHHASQGGVQGEHADLLKVVGHGVRSARWDTQGSIWNDLVVLVFTEFGRTSRENGSLGTDHGTAAALFAAGGSVLGGVHNCDPGTWPAQSTLLSENNKYVAHRTDFRAVLAEVLQRHLGVPAGSLGLVIPGWGGLGGPTFQQLGFLP